jgi:hypothetical protein
MSDRSERREEIRLFLEYVKMAFSILGIVTIVFAALQWRASNKTADESNYQQIASAWRDHLKIFLDKSDARPYFEAGQPLAPDDKNSQLVLAIADLRLDVADAILTYAYIHGAANQIEGWRKTFESAFKTSPVLCARFLETQTNYGLIAPIGRNLCQPKR